MKSNVLQALGVAAGTGTYQVAAHGLASADWYRVGFVGIFCFVVFSLIDHLKNRKLKVSPP